MRSQRFYSQHRYSRSDICMGRHIGSVQCGEERGKEVWSSQAWWFEKLDNLRRVPVGKTFDEEGKRCWLTRSREPSC